MVSQKSFSPATTPQSSQTTESSYLQNKMAGPSTAIGCSNTSTTANQNPCMYPACACSEPPRNDLPGYPLSAAWVSEV
ncbi:hypothetical protein DAEQUDRAFT_721180 [Daedalea quercina L-15889]|uniref:Uncharacterized protein n=1 Tax=Daedalea quercina L-15889 TaxID=1314783 RepID=A0A165TP15_9APHY|nr:hypothetical protein DAEQUDRAFT_721180 [Daedalea quercina L-15889]